MLSMHVPSRKQPYYPILPAFFIYPQSPFRFAILICDCGHNHTMPAEYKTTYKTDIHFPSTLKVFSVFQFMPPLMHMHRAYRLWLDHATQLHISHCNSLATLQLQTGLVNFLHLFEKLVSGEWTETAHCVLEQSPLSKGQVHSWLITPLCPPSTWTGPIPWTATWRWWSTNTAWCLHPPPRRCLGTPDGSTWKNTVSTRCAVHVIHKHVM